MREVAQIKTIWNIILPYSLRPVDIILMRFAYYKELPPVTKADETIVCDRFYVCILKN